VEKDNRFSENGVELTRSEWQIYHISDYKTKRESDSLSCKSDRFKTANIIFFLQIQSTYASDHICVGQWPVINVKASFCA